LPTAFCLEVGNREVQTHVKHREDVFQVISQIDGVKRFRDVLRSLGISVSYQEFDGAHEFNAWKRALPAALRWTLSTEQMRRRESG